MLNSQVWYLQFFECWVTGTQNQTHRVWVSVRAREYDAFANVDTIANVDVIANVEISMSNSRS